MTPFTGTPSFVCNEYEMAIPHVGFKFGIDKITVLRSFDNVTVSTFNDRSL